MKFINKTKKDDGFVVGTVFMMFLILVLSLATVTINVQSNSRYISSMMEKDSAYYYSDYAIRRAQSDIFYAIEELNAIGIAEEDQAFTYVDKADKEAVEAAYLISKDAFSSLERYASAPDDFVEEIIIPNLDYSDLVNEIDNLVKLEAKIYNDTNWGYVIVVEAQTKGTSQTNGARRVIGIKLVLSNREHKETDNPYHKDRLFSATFGGTTEILFESLPKEEDEIAK